MAIEAAPLVDRTASLGSASAALSGLVRYRELVRGLVVKDLKLKYRGSVLGFLWSLVNPLVMLAVYTFAFTYVLQVRIEGFVFRLLLGILAWGFFAGATTMSTGAIVDNGGLIKSVLFPRVVLPIATVLFNLAQYLLMTVVLLPVMMAIYGRPPGPPAILFPVVVALQTLLTIGLALLLSAGATFFRDVRHLLDIALSILFWTTPIVYAFAQVPERFRPALLLSPLTPFVVSYHRIFYDREWPEPQLLALMLAYATVSIVIGSAVFLRAERRFTEQV